MQTSNTVRPSGYSQRRRFGALAAIFAIAIAGPVAAQDEYGCGQLKNAYGPFDYTNATHFNEKLPIVEKHHYDLGVQILKGVAHKANGAWNLHNDIDYTLRAFPNHHRALYTMTKYYLEKVRKTGAPKMRYSPECYFDRATRWRPNDATVRMINGLYLHRIGKTDDALVLYEQAVAMAPNSAEIHYNIGLLYASLKDYDDALDHAHKAYDLGYPLPGLRNKLKRAGKWTTRVAETSPVSDGYADAVDDTGTEVEAAPAADPNAPTN